MRRTLARILGVASVPVGVGVGLWTAQLRSFPDCAAFGPCAGWPSGPPPTFALWQCALFGATAAVVVLFLTWAGSRTNVLRVWSVPVGVGVGLWTAQVTTGPSNQCPGPVPCLDILYAQTPTFLVWQCALFGGGAALTLLALSFADNLTSALRVLSVPVGVGVGLWSAQVRSLPYCPLYGRCLAYIDGVLPLTFAPWQCALFGAGAAVAMLLLVFLVARPPNAGRLKAA
jgi:hypothetical protein